MEVEYSNHDSGGAQLTVRKDERHEDLGSLMHDGPKR